MGTEILGREIHESTVMGLTTAGIIIFGLVAVYWAWEYTITGETRALSHVQTMAFMTIICTIIFAFEQARLSR